LNVRLATLVVTTGSLFALVGCGRTPQIEHYSVPKQSAIDKLTGADKAGKDRMVAAIVGHSDQNWFFKLSGQSDLVAEQAEQFTALVKSVRFGDQGTPQWTLPKGWRERPAEGMRFATLEIETSGGTLEASVTSLPRGEGVDESSYALSNINRWRGQLSLSPIDEAELDQQTTKVELDGSTALLVNFEGKLKPGGMGQPPFAGGPMAGPLTGASGAPEARSGPGESAEMTYQVPEGWEELGPGPMGRKAGFRVTDGDRLAEITISTAGGGLLANVNRWRGQVMLEPIDEEQLQSGAQFIAVGESKGAYFRLVGPERTILGVVAPVAGDVWFIKLAGDNELAEHERERFEQFVKSIHFSGAEGADDGQ
jgi:hypothetical protein